MINAARSATVDAFARAPLPKRFCNLDRLLHAMKTRGLDGIVATAPWNVFYLTAFNAIAHKADEPRPYAVILPSSFLLITTWRRFSSSRRGSRMYGRSAP